MIYLPGGNLYLFFALSLIVFITVWIAKDSEQKIKVCIVSTILTFTIPPLGVIFLLYLAFQNSNISLMKTNKPKT